MAEDGSGSGLFDTRQYTYLPGWAKSVVLGAAAALLLLAIVMIYRTLGEGDGDFIIFYVSLAQTTALILIFAVMVLFSTRDANVGSLHRLGDVFLKSYMIDALQRVSIPARGIPGFEVKDLGAKDIFGRVLGMEAPGVNFRLWVGLNVHRLFVIYFIPLDETVTVERVREVFQFTFGGAEHVGFQVNYEQAEADGVRFVSIWLTQEVTKDLLYSPREKLFWAQDIAMMTESLLRTASRNAISVETGDLLPGPL